MTIAKTKLIKVRLVVGEGTGEVKLHTRVELPRPAIKVFKVKSELEEVEASVAGEQVLIEGAVHHQIFFVGEDDRIYHKHVEVEFEEFVHVPGCVLKKEQDAQVRWQIQKIVWDHITPHHVDIFLLIIFFIKITETVQVNAFLSPVGPLLRTEVVIGENVCLLNPVHDCHLHRPAIRIRDIEIVADDIDSEVLDDHVRIRGVVEAQIFFVGEDGCGYHQHCEFEFEGKCEIPGVLDGMNVDVAISVVKVEKSLSHRGHRLELRVFLQAFIKVTETAQVAVQLHPAGPLVQTQAVVAEKIIEQLVEQRDRLHREAIEIQDIEAELDDFDFEVLSHKVIIHAVLRKHIFFVGCDELLHHQKVKERISVVVEIPGCLPHHHALVDGRVEHVSWQEDGGDDGDEDDSFRFVRVRTVIEFFVKISEEVQITIAAVAVDGALLAAEVGKHDGHDHGHAGHLHGHGGHGGHVHGGHAHGGHTGHLHGHGGHGGHLHGGQVVHPGFGGHGGHGGQLALAGQGQFGVHNPGVPGTI